MLSCFSHVQLSAIPWTEAHQVPLSMGFFRQEYWSVLPCPPPEGLLDPGIKSTSLMSPELAGRFFTTSATWEAGIYFSTDTLQGGTVTCSPLVISQLEKEMATHSSVLAWRIPGTGEPCGLLSMGSHRFFTT